ncbi:MAG: Ig-like domain-containing protein [Chloroflexi bacterium]|nr:Ig-like domain-containing protein [Chloroflexota bacterium]
MRKLAAAALAVPVLGLLYSRSLVTRRRGLGLAATLIVAASIVGAGAISPPPPTTASIPGQRFDALAELEFATEIRTSESPSSPVTISFPARMNAASVAASLSVDPPTAMTLVWDDSHTMLTVRPKAAWAPATFHTITIAAGALDASGTPMANTTRAAFLTREATTATILAVDVVRDEVLSTSSVLVTFARPILESTLGLNVTPGGVAFEAIDTGGVPTTIYRFAPTTPLQPDTTYTISLSPTTLDADGAPVAAASLELRTAGIPTVVRFRPASKATGIARDALYSVRFSEPMDHSSAEAAFSAKVGATTRVGTFTWHENDTVLVFHPKSGLGYSMTVVLAVAGTATSQAGVPLARGASSTFTTGPKPAPPPAPAPAPSSSGGGGGGGGGSVGSATWYAVETYYLKLLNCTRQGGWVTSTGSCSSPGGSRLNALILSKGISDNVARPYAKLLVTRGLCTHTADGSPGDRLRRAGYDSAYWGENIGCRSGNPYDSVLASHLYFQSEKSYNGGHWRNIVRPDFTHVGIGVWVYSGRVRLVTDFYWPR